ncbi:hypothetical protein [Nocardioides lianchengensis]|uniref:ASCH domain-containing protein n=1 Tax=Nocardioides lianchengensis TaxID=1045774 RepID=A0A1G6LQF3_9ACTN|nr:hypothetical protein [Nocardioides lianchengensis]NYG12477.1 hypothetical protein [Nocardioides lianchengensis]SDC45421.1 hypothetical protein SAMN05421872_102327 [Nocardioides lianchengensis]
MKAISIRQPWAWAILAGGKDVENRSRNVVGAHRGWTLVHAGLQLDAAGLRAAEDLANMRMPQLGGPGSPPEVQLGGVVGVMNVVGAHRAYDCGGQCSRWAEPTGWHIEIRDRRPLRRMVPCPGRLGLFTPDQLILGAIRRQEMS